MQRRILGMVFLAMVAVTLSCEKQTPAFRKAQLIVENNDNPKIGDNDDDPIIHGKVKKKHNLAPVDGAQVGTYVYGTDALISNQYTNASGEFTKQVTNGTYYFKVTVPGSTSPYVTDKFIIIENTEVIILVD